MKIGVKPLARIASMIILMHTCLLPVEAQKVQDKNAGILGSVDARQFTFVAESISPLRGGLRQLTSYYDLRIAKDTVISNLPYFGRAYVAPMNPSESGLNFTAVATGYVAKVKKKGRREISIQTKVAGDAPQMMLTVFDNGSASLQVSSNNRDPVSFNGYVKATEKK